MKVTEIEVHRITLPYVDWISYQLNHYYGPISRTIYVAHTDDGLVGLGESHNTEPQETIDGYIGTNPFDHVGDEASLGLGTAMYDLMGKVEIITGTLGKAFGGAIGGFTTGKKEIIELLRQRSRPYLFSNSIPPLIAAAGIEMVHMMSGTNNLMDKLRANIAHFNKGMQAAGFDMKPTQSAICAVMLYDAKLSQEFAARLLDEGIYVIGFYYPVVPKEPARIRVQLSAAHEPEHLDKAIAAFTKVGKELGVIK